MRINRVEKLASDKAPITTTFFARNRNSITSIAIACALSAVAAQPTDACGPFSKIAVFVTSNHPDFPMKRFASGELGVINPHYARSFLVVGYRYLAGVKSSPADQKAFVALWDRRLEALDVDVQIALKAWTTERNKVLNVKAKDVNAYDTNGYMGYLTYNADAFNTATATLRSKIEKYGAGDQKVKDWLTAQDAIFGISSESDNSSTAKKESTESVAAAGASDDSKYQSACEDFYSKRFDAAAEKFQAIAADSSSSWQQWGNYLAARSFCRKATIGDVVSAEDLQQAKTLLEKVLQSKETATMHAAAKRLMSFVDFRLNPSGRAKEVVGALLATSSGEDLTEALGDYTLLLDKVLEKQTSNTPTSMRIDDTLNNDASAPENTLLSVAALGVLGLFGMHRLWWRTKAQRISLSHNSTIALALTFSVLSCGVVACTKTESANVSQTKVSTHVVATATNAGDKNLPSAADVILDDDMTKWILNYQDSKKESLKQAMDEWQKSKSLPWLVSVISKIEATNPDKATVLAEAEKVTSDSPAYITLQYHQIRLLIDENKPKEAAARINTLLTDIGSKLPPSARNGLFEMGVACAGSLAEFVKFAAPSPAVITWDYDSNELPDTDSDFEPGPVKLTPINDYFKYTGCLTDESANIVNKVTPLQTYVSLATNPGLPATVRLDLAQAGWVRSVLLKNEKMAMTLSPVLSKLRLQLSKSLTAYDTAKSGTDKEYAALITILRNPGMRPYVTPGLPRETAFDKIDDYRNNWWDASMPEAPRNMYADDDEDNKSEAKVVNAAFLSAPESSQGKEETAAITAIGTAPNSLAQRVLALSKANPKDPRLAEMLHLVVATTRYGNTDDKTTAYSKQAFQALHKNFPGSEWTKKTKFWF